jgi:hypothetical protein
MANNNAHEYVHMEENLLDMSTENRNDQDKQAALYKEWGVFDDINSIKLDKNNNLLVLTKSVSKAEDLFKNFIVFMDPKQTKPQLVRKSPGSNN